MRTQNSKHNPEAQRRVTNSTNGKSAELPLVTKGFRKRGKSNPFHSYSRKVERSRLIFIKKEEDKDCSILILGNEKDRDYFVFIQGKTLSYYLR